MKRRYLKKLFLGMVAVSMPLFSATYTYAQEKQPQPAGTSTYSPDDANSDEDGISNPEVNQSINDAYRANAPVIRNYMDVNRKQIISPHKDIPFKRDLIFIPLPNQTYDAMGNSPVNNNSGAYNPRQSVNMPQSTITQPPLPYKNGGTYYQANDSLLRPPVRNW